MAVMTNVKSKHHEYIFHEIEGYHEFIALESTRRIVEIYMELTEELTIKTLSGELPEPPIRVLIDFTPSGMFPLRMLFSLYKKFLEKYPNAPYGRIAYVTKDASTDALMGGGVGTVATGSHAHKGNMRKFFNAHEREQALVWLLSDE
jgi:hypothetical protein